MRVGACVALACLLASPALAEATSPVEVAENHLRVLDELADPNLLAVTPRLEETLSSDLEIATPDPETMPAHPPPREAASMLINELAISRSRLHHYSCAAAAPDMASCALFFASNDGRCFMKEVRRFSVRGGRIVRISYFHYTGDFSDAETFRDFRVSGSLAMLGAMDIVFGECDR